jgi:methylthioribose-1-phosphate isomerase
VERLLPFRFDEEEGVFWLLDQRRLPQEEVWVPVRTAREMAQAIRDMVVRGAPAIGVSAAFGMVLAHMAGEDLEEADRLLRQSRPTAVNLFHALDRMRPHFGDLKGSLEEAKALWREVEETERAISQHGAKVLKGQVLTHCNTGPLATGGGGRLWGPSSRPTAKAGSATSGWTRPGPTSREPASPPLSS